MAVSCQTRRRVRGDGCRGRSGVSGRAHAREKSLSVGSASLLAAGLAPNLTVLAVALTALGMFAAIYHPVGTAMLMAQAKERGRSVAFNGVCGNCPSSIMLVVNGIEEELRKHIPEVAYIEAVP